MQEINENSTYDEAFIVSIKAIRKVYKMFGLRFSNIEYDDFLQECAVYYYSKIVNKYSPLVACNAEIEIYKYVAYNMLRSNKKKYDEVDINNIQIVDKRNSKYFSDNVYELTDLEYQIVLLIEGGFALEEIAEIIHRTPRTTQSYMTNIRKKLADYYGIEDFSKFKRVYVRSEESKQKMKEENIRTSGKPVGCYVDDKLEFTCRSLGEAAEKLQVSTPAVFQALKNNKKCKGYFIKYLEGGNK